MRILAVSHTAVWPVRSGSAIRRLTTLRALQKLGTVDLLYVGEVDGYGERVPDDAPVQRVWEMPVARVRPGALARAAWLVRPRVPYQMIEWGAPAAARSVPNTYDMIWYFRPVTYELTHGLRGGGTVIDLDDLEDEKLRQTLAERTSRRFRQRVAERRNLTVWSRYQRRLAARVEAVTVCKDADCQRLGARNCRVVPNGFPEVPLVSGAPSGPPVLLFVGLFSYGPNADAAEFFVEEVLPRIRAARPDAEVRLVGRNAERVRRLARPGVEVVGPVDDLAEEYERAWTAVVPIRIQSGTRVKILEAFARGVPVVSTRAGAAGLDAHDGEHLLLADDPRSFAEACLSLLDAGSELRSRLTGRAHDLYQARFGQQAVTRAVRDVTRSIGLTE